MRTQKQNWMRIALALASMALVPTREGRWSPDPEQALLGRTKAVFQLYEVSTSKPSVSGEQALVGRIAGNSARVSTDSRNRITAEFALLGR